jgi:enoyl-CoA hydratase
LATWRDGPRPDRSDAADAGPLALYVPVLKFLDRRRTNLLLAGKEIPHVTVELERHEGTMVALLDDGKANALSFEMIAGLQLALAASIEENVPLVIAGRPGYFSAGFDLQVMRSGDPARIGQLVDQGALLFRQVFAAPIPVLAACTGHALAAGALLLLAADYRIGQPGPHKIGLNETQIGLDLPQFAVDMARLRLSPNRLLAATLFADILSPEEACAVGYLDRITEDAGAATRALAEEVALLNSSVFARTKKRLNAEIVRRLSEPANSDGQA